MNALADIIHRNRTGEAVAVPSVCSAHPDVLDAALLLAGELNRQMLIEATSNQCNQFGGYTGLTPADFIHHVKSRAAELGVPETLLVFGGDHLGPQAWKKEPAASAMAKARDMMAAYVKAGFTKIHLDCSEGCAGEPAQLDDETTARRSAELASVCEAHAPDPDALCYIIGTEVPPPGGARADHDGIRPTNPERAVQTLEIHHKSFLEAGQEAAWSRVCGLVVQPGIEFGPIHIDHFPETGAGNLPEALKQFPAVCFEAHSTDYQRDAVYPRLAEANFAVLKVGPALTFAYRQALYALDAVLHWLQPDPARNRVPAVMEGLMLESPGSWQGHYSGDEDALRLQHHFGYADRIRYYWPDERAEAAVSDLIARLTPLEAPAPLLSQYFAPDVLTSASRLKTKGISWPRALILAQIQSALSPYFF